MKKWEKKLTGKERKHLREVGCTTISALKRTREEQRKDEARWKPGEPVTMYGCLTCKAIARKLGIEEEMS